MSTVPVSIVRGGTSRAVFLPMSELPADPAARDELCLRLIGSPDPVAVDGLGGGVSSNSKVMFVGPATSPGADLESLFAQVSPAERDVDWAGNCGNISAAVSAYALDEGMLRLRGRQADVRVRNLNTGSVFELSHPLLAGRLSPAGDFRLDGVPGTAARIDVRFLRPGGSVTGARLSGFEATLIDVANPVVILRAADLGVDAGTGPAELNADAGLLARLEELRAEGARAMGLAPSRVVPRVALVAPGGDGCLLARMTSVGRVHHALPGTGLLALGAAVALGGSVIDLPPAPETVIRHPKGQATVSAQVLDGRLEWVALARSARIILRGEASL